MSSMRHMEEDGLITVKVSEKLACNHTRSSLFHVSAGYSSKKTMISDQSELNHNYVKYFKPLLSFVPVRLKGGQSLSRSFKALILKQMHLLAYDARYKNLVGQKAFNFSKEPHLPSLEHAGTS